MRKAAALPLVMMILIAFSCKKSDLPTEKKFQSALTIPSGSPILLRRISEEWRKKELKSPYLEKLFKTNGVPRWQNSIITEMPKFISKGSSAASEIDTLVIIPLVPEGDSFVHSFVVWQVQGDLSQTTLYNGADYRSYGYDTTKIRNARTIVGTLMLLDNFVFGHDAYKLKDGRLFAGIEDSSAVIQFSGKLEGSTTMHCYTISYEPNLLSGYDGGRSGEKNGVLAGPIKETHCISWTIYTWQYEETTTGGSGGGGDTGTGTSGSTGCRFYDGGCSGGQMPVDPANIREERVFQLSQLLQAHPDALLSDPCQYLSQYLSLLSFQVPTSVQSKINQASLDYLNSNILSYSQYVTHPCYIQNVQDASSAVINFDYFPIHITQLPSPGGNPMTSQQLFEMFRNNINLFVDANIASFQPYHDLVVDDAGLYSSSNPLTAFLHLDMVEDGTVVVSHFNSTVSSSQMIVTTVRTPLDGQHPVSGNRSWGIEVDNVNGGYVFYTTGVDRVTGVLETVFNTWLGRLPLFGINSGFQDADDLWTSLQTNMIQYINSNGGQAQFYNLLEPNYIKRPKWQDVDAYLSGTISFQELKQRIGC